MKADIEVGGAGTGTLALDGVDISRGVRSFIIDGRVGDLTTLTIDLGLTHGASLKGEVAVRLTRDAEIVLKQLGWTPPALPDAVADPADPPPQG